MEIQEIHYEIHTEKFRLYVYSEHMFIVSFTKETSTFKNAIAIVSETLKDLRSTDLNWDLIIIPNL